MVGDASEVWRASHLLGITRKKKNREQGVIFDWLRRFVVTHGTSEGSRAGPMSERVVNPVALEQDHSSDGAHDLE